ncbi:MAG: hypothetical protein HC862_08855 [Scytonema sp. RU_4_4]|nr:hypothetical protein [Scytonema sp. RU_4_4]
MITGLLQRHLTKQPSASVRRIRIPAVEKLEKLWLAVDTRYSVDLLWASKLLNFLAWYRQRTLFTLTQMKL